MTRAERLFRANAQTIALLILLGIVAAIALVPLIMWARHDIVMARSTISHVFPRSQLRDESDQELVEFARRAIADTAIFAGSITPSPRRESDSAGRLVFRNASDPHRFCVDFNTDEPSHRGITVDIQVGVNEIDCLFAGEVVIDLLRPPAE